MENEDKEKQFSAATCAIWIKEEPPEDLCEEYDYRKDSDVEPTEDLVKVETRDPLTLDNEFNGTTEQEISDETSQKLSQEKLISNPEHIIVDAEPPFNEGSAEVVTNKPLNNETAAFQNVRSTQKKTLRIGLNTNRKRPMKKIFARQNEDSLATSKLLKQKQLKEEKTEESSAIDTAVNLLRIASTRLSHSQSEDDEITIFFKYVCTKVKNYSPKTKKEVQKAIFDVLMKAD